MLILLPVATFGLLWYLLSREKDALGLSRLSYRGILVVAYLIFQAWLEITTELTSFGHDFTRGWLIVSWSVPLIILTALAWPNMRKASRNIPTRLPLLSAIRNQIRRIGAENFFWLGIVALILGILGYLGWSFLPSNGDSLVYHLARVEHWIQDRSVGPFPAHYFAQLELSPLSEFNFAHAQLLTGRDHLDGYVQLLACIVCLVAVSEVTRLLGGSRSTQVIAVVICATIPSGILVATSTENDYFAAAIGISLIVVALSWTRGGNWWFPSLIFGLGVGLAYMAKGTIPALLGPAVALILLQRFVSIYRSGPSASIQKWVGSSGTIAIAALVVVAPFVSQNVTIFGSAVGPVSKSTLSTNLTLPAAGANVVRSTAANFMIGNGSDGFETAISKSVLGDLHGVFDQFHIDPRNPNYVLGTITNAFAVNNYVQSERSGDRGADPWDVLLICIAALVLIVARIRGDRMTRMPLLIAAGLTLGYLLFSGTARWNVFDVRYQLPLYVAWSPIIAIALSKLPRVAARVVLCLLVVACLPQLFDNVEQPFIHRDYPMASLAPYFLDTNVQTYVTLSSSDYQSASAAISETSCHSLGLANWILAEYPLWVGLRNAGWQGEIQNVNVENASSRFQDPAFAPCILVRQETGSYVGADRSQVNLRFGPLAIAVAPQVARSLRLPVAGFHSTVTDVRVLPGGGWSINGEQGEPTLKRPGSIFLFSPDRRTVELQIRGDTATAPARAVISQTGIGAGPTTLSSGNDIPIVVSPGITEVQVDPIQDDAASTPKVAGVEISPTPPRR